MGIFSAVVAPAGPCMGMKTGIAHGMYVCGNSSQGRSLLDERYKKATQHFLRGKEVVSEESKSTARKCSSLKVSHIIRNSLLPCLPLSPSSFPPELSQPFVHDFHRTPALDALSSLIGHPQPPAQLARASRFPPSHSSDLMECATIFVSW